MMPVGEEHCPGAQGSSPPVVVPLVCVLMEHEGCHGRAWPLVPKGELAVRLPSIPGVQGQCPVLQRAVTLLR